MLIVRTPLRLSLLGGGSDLPQFHSMNTGHTISCALKKYIYITIHKSHEPKKILLKYSKMEEVKTPEEISHPVFRAVLSKYSVNSVDISVNSDVPSGSGLGSSSTFTVALLHAIRGYLNLEIDKHSLALEACEIEIDILKENIGLQDQFIASYGGIRHFSYSGERKVVTHDKPLKNLSRYVERNGCLIRFVGGGPRSAGKLLKSQVSDANWTPSVAKITGIAKSYLSLSKPTLLDLTKHIDTSWEIKASLSEEVSPPELNSMILKLRKLGGRGIKLLGAGNSGYVLAFGTPLFLNKIHDVFPDIIYPKIDYTGSRVIFSDEVMREI